MESQWKRPKEVISQTEALSFEKCGAIEHENVDSPCGTIYMTFGYEDKEKTRLIEVMLVIGKGGTCGNCHLANFGKSLSCWLQTEQARYKIIQKLKKNFVESNCGNIIINKDKKYYSCHDYIAQRIIKELEKQIGG